jgi:hypothetical protein
MRALAAAALTCGALCTGAASLWTMAQNPLARPLVERSADEVRVALERAMAREVTPDWLLPRLDEALAAGDADRVGMLAGLATQYGVALTGEQWQAVDAALAPPDLVSRATECAACAWDVRSCPSVTLIAACALPVELTPAGDANALRRQAQAALAGEDVDEIETGLALVGLGASGAILVTGGSSAAVKAGATVARLARRMGTLSPGMTRMLREAADIPIAWDRVLPYVAGSARLEDVTDVARLTRLGGVAQDMGTVAWRTSPAEALVLLRHVDSAEDAARLARLSTVAGPRTRATIEVLGTARAFRTLTRVTDLALAAIGLVAALVAQLGSLAVSVLMRGLGRALRPRPVARRPKARHDRFA